MRGWSGFRGGCLVKLVSCHSKTGKRERGLVVASDDWLRAKKELVLFLLSRTGFNLLLRK